MKMKNIFAFCMAGMMLFATGCNGNDVTTESTTESKTEAQNKSEGETESEAIEQVTELTEDEKKIIDTSGVYPQLEEKVDGEIIATMKTNKGDIVLRLFPDKAPKAVENFVTHAKEGYYDGLIFHRVIKDFMIQGGDPKGNGTGGESIWGKNFDDEITSSMRSFRGALCMANSGPNTNGSQFYIVQNNKLDDNFKTQFQELLNKQDDYLNPQSGAKVKDIYPTEVINEYIKNGGCPYLDFGYTIFGQVKSGMDVVDEIANVKTNESDKPLENIIINSIEVM